MQLLLTFLTVVLVLDCLLLTLLVLIQLPKKEAGVGLAFGGGATDALFGAGSGNALTKLTKYSAGAFLGLALILGVMNAKLQHGGESDVRKALSASRPVTTPAPVTTTKPASQFQILTSGTNSTTAPAATAPATNAVARPATATATTNTTGAAK
jgi:protein translocase SecG subunit